MLQPPIPGSKTIQSKMLASDIQLIRLAKGLPHMSRTRQLIVSNISSDVDMPFGLIAELALKESEAEQNVAQLRQIGFVARSALH